MLSGNERELCNRSFSQHDKINCMYDDTYWHNQICCVDDLY
jgi:hypothetical protein